MHSYALLLFLLLSAVIADAGLYKQFAFSINAAGGQNALLSMLCLSGNPVDEGAHSDVLEICV